MILFAFFGFMWATMAAGVGAIAIPVVIHLINSKRFKIVPWAAMKFLLAAQKQTRKRMRIEQLLLLLTRMLILALTIFAMASVMDWAEGWWKDLGIANIGPAKAGRAYRVHHVFVLDASLSMNQKVDGNLTAFEVAQQYILKKIADNPSGDGYSVLILKDSPTWLVGEASQDARKVIREVEAAKASHGNASVPAALNMVASKLNEARNRFPKQAVYFFTDMQQSTWQGNHAAVDRKVDVTPTEKNPYLEIDERATTIFVDCGPTTSNNNIAITNVEFDLSQSPYVTTDTEFNVFATLRNFGNDDKTVRPELLTGRAKDGAGDPAIQLRAYTTAEGEEVKAHSSRTFTFKKVKFDKAGTFAVQVKLPEDSLEQDNSRTIIMTVRKDIPVLVVNGKLSADRFDRATEYLRLALNPFPVGNEPKFAPLRPRVVSPGEFSQIPDADMEAYDCIFWCDVPTFGGNDLRKVDMHLRRGGGFVVTLGEQVNKNGLGLYNEFKWHKEGYSLLPGTLMKKIESGKDHYFYFQNTDPDAFATPPLAAFVDEVDRMTLRTARFRNFIDVVVPEGKARTVLSFMPEAHPGENVKRNVELPVNRPAIVEWNPPLSRAQQPAPGVRKPGQRVDRQAARYRGKVVLLTSTVNMDWTSWPGSPSFVPMMQELTRLAVSGRLREQSTVVGGMLDGFFPGAVETDVTLNYPADVNAKPATLKTQVIDEVNIFRWSETDFAGVYRAEARGGNEIPFAVNVPVNSVDLKGSESDLKRIDEDPLRNGYPGWTMQIVRNPLHGTIAAGPINEDAVDAYQPVGPFLANVALLIVLGLLFLEIVLAWHFGHYTTTEGAVAQATPSPTVTMVALAFAVATTILVCIGAGILIHERYTGDFLGFLPEILREWVEYVMNIDAPLPGEGRNWNLEGNAFLFGIPGPEQWYAVLISIGAVALIFFTYKAEAPRVSLLFKLLLGVLRFCLILTILWFLLPRHALHYSREGWPDLVILIDDSRSMGEADTFHDGPVIEKVGKLSEEIKAKLKTDIPERLTALDAEIARIEKADGGDPDKKAEAESLRVRQKYWKLQQENLDNGKWRPSRLQLVQAILAQPEPHWLKTIMAKHKTKIHIFHLDINGRATKLRDLTGDVGDVVDPADTKSIDKAQKAMWNLGPVGNDSRLGTAVRQVIDHYRGSSLSSVIMFTDGVTTRDETLVEVSEYAKHRNVSLLFIGVGDENEQRDLKLQHLNVEDPIYIGDAAVFEVSVVGHGYKNTTVPVILKLKDPVTKKENEVGKREMVKIDPSGKAVKVRLRDTPKKIGAHHYIIEIVPPTLQPNEKPIPPANLRIERTIDVIDTKLIRVLYVESQPRYEYRYIKFLMEREAPDEKKGADDKKKKKSIELKVLLLDADLDFHKNDKTALEHFPPTLAELNEYDVLIMGDCDPTHKKLQNHLKDIVAFVNGEDEKGKKAAKSGGGILFIAGAFNNPHRFKGTPLANVLPIEPTADQPPPEIPREIRMRPELTEAGKMHQIFRFGPNAGENIGIWKRLTPMYWHSAKYRPKPLAEILAVHETEKAEKEHQGENRLPLVVAQFAPGRSMFFGFDETWRWRRGEDELKYNNFWIQTMRYLARGQSTRTELKLDKQEPYRVGEKIKVMVRFPQNAPGGNEQGPKLDAKTEVKVSVTYTPPEAEKLEPVTTPMTLKKVPGSFGTYEDSWDRTREGKYKFRLVHPDVSATQPDLEKPSAEAIVELPPGELDKLRMDYQGMTQAANNTPDGQFFTLANADRALDAIPPGDPTHIVSNAPPTLLWNQWWVFVLIVLLITSEWVLRKMKHLL